MDQKQFHSVKDSEVTLQSLTLTIRKKIGEGAQKTESLFSSASIYKVPKALRKLKKSAYIPRLIAIGPLHQKDKHLQTPIRHVKLSYTNFLFCRLTEGMEDAEQKKFDMLQKCVAEMKALIDDAKKCYAKEVMLDEEMLLMDGCFILELLYRFSLIQKEGKKPIKEGDNGKSNTKSQRPVGMTHQNTNSSMQRPMREMNFVRLENTIQQPRGEEEHTKSSNSKQMADPIFDSILTANTIQHDLLLLENQIPLFVLEKLFGLTVNQIPERPQNYSLTHYVSDYFGDMMSPEGKSKNSDSCCSPSDLVLWVFGNQMKNSKEEEEEGDIRSTNAHYNHILHKIHEDYLPREEKKKKEHNEIMPSASNLDYAGVKFVPGTGNDLFNVKFSEPKGPLWWCHRACFEIPPLGIYDLTEAFLRNLIAFEQCYPGASQHFTSYAYLMDMLVNSEKDVEVLEKAGVVHNYLGANEDATNLFNKLCKETALGEFFFADKCNEATMYSERCWPKNMAHVRRKYFASPWTFIAFCLALIVFGISITQFVRSFLK